MRTWKTVPGFNNYEVSSDGLVRTTPKIMKPRYLRGYVRFALFDAAGVPHAIQAHRLVWETFRSPLGELQINHINGIKDDNRLENLEPATLSQNLLHRYRVLGQNGVRGSKNNLAKLTEDKVLEIRARLEKGESHVDLAQIFGVTRSNIYCIASRKTWDHI